MEFKFIIEPNSNEVKSFYEQYIDFLKSQNNSSKFYLVNYIWTPHRGSAICPHRSAIYEFEKNKSPKECFDLIDKDLNSDSNEYDRYYCTITDMKLIY